MLLTSSFSLVELLVGKAIGRMAGLFGRVLFFDVDRQRRKGGGHRGPELAAKRVDHQPGGIDAAGPLIEMRIGAIGDQGVRCGDHRRRKVGVGVERADDRAGPGRRGGAARRANGHRRRDRAR